MTSLATNPVLPGSSRSPLVARIVAVMAFVLLVILGASIVLHESGAVSASSPVPAGPGAAGSGASFPTTTTGTAAVTAVSAGTTAGDTTARATSAGADAALAGDSRQNASVPGAETSALASGASAPTDVALGCCLLGAACCLLLLVMLVRAVRRPAPVPLSLAPRLRPAPLAHGRLTTPALTLPQLSVLRT